MQGNLCRMLYVVQIYFPATIFWIPCDSLKDVCTDKLQELFDNYVVFMLMVMPLLC